MSGVELFSVVAKGEDWLALRMLSFFAGKVPDRLAGVRVGVDFNSEGSRVWRFVATDSYLLGSYLSCCEVPEGVADDFELVIPAEVVKFVFSVKKGVVRVGVADDGVTVAAAGAEKGRIEAVGVAGKWVDYRQVVGALPYAAQNSQHCVPVLAHDRLRDLVDAAKVIDCALAFVTDPKQVEGVSAEKPVEVRFVHGGYVSDVKSENRYVADRFDVVVMPVRVSAERLG